ncbi:DUF4214 domain-containing protein [Mesorhizobium sp. CAU 1741]|uniref:DUF4214 domain-containing protein n=1 Tax=Mesorhizobium sp. CAU 1741 TaxID=3140366 RepID=UPI00325AD23A
MATNVSISIELGDSTQSLSEVDVTVFEGGSVADNDGNINGFSGVYFSAIKQTATYYNITITSDENTPFDIGSLVVADTGDTSDYIFVWRLDSNGNTTGSMVGLFTENVDVNSAFSSQILELNFEDVYGIKLEYMDNSGGPFYFDSDAFAAVSVAPSPDTTAPTLVSNTPADDATGFAADANIVLTFDEDMVAGSGDIVIVNVDDPSDSRTIAVGESQVTIDGKTVTINPTDNLKPDANYYIEIASGVLEDANGNAFAGISSATDLNFTVAKPSTGGGGSKPKPKPEPEPNIVHTDDDGQAVATDEAETFVGEDDAIDAVSLSGSREDFTVTRNEDGSFTIKGTGAADTLQSIERLHFDDGVLALDVEAEPGLAFRLYQAAFGREADEAGLGFWIERLDDGEIDLLGLAQSFIQSDEFESLYGNGVENLSFIELLYENILGREFEDDGFAFWQEALENGATYDWLLAVFSESEENVENIAPLIADGIWYQL